MTDYCLTQLRAALEASCPREIRVEASTRATASGRRLTVVTLGGSEGAAPLWAYVATTGRAALAGPGRASLELADAGRPAVGWVLMAPARYAAFADALVQSFARQLRPSIPRPSLPTLARLEWGDVSHPSNDRNAWRSKWIAPKPRPLTGQLGWANGNDKLALRPLQAPGRSVAAQERFDPSQSADTGEGPIWLYHRGLLGFLDAQQPIEPLTAYMLDAHRRQPDVHRECR